MVAMEQGWSLGTNGCMFQGFGGWVASVKMHSCWLVVCSEAFRKPANNELCCVNVVEAVNLPHPKMPGFFVERSSNKSTDESSTSENVELHSENTMSFTNCGR